MRLKTFVTSSIRSQKSKNLIPHPQKRPCPLLIPEILKHILSFLSQSTLRYSAVLVSRLWSSIAQELIQRTVFWNTTKSSQSPYTRTVDLDRIDFADALVLHCESLSNVLHPVTASRPKNRQNILMLNKLETVARNGKLRVRDLDVLMKTDAMDWSGMSLLLKIMGPSLTHLRLKTFSLSHIFPLSAILESCPSLLMLQVEASSDEYDIEASQLEEPPITPGAIQTSLLTSHEDTSQDEVAVSTSNKWRLQSCTLDDMYLTATALEALLASCPDLIELRLISIRSRLFSQTREKSLHVQEPREQFLRQLNLLCPGLKSLHISLRNGPVQVSEPLVAELPSLLTEIDSIGVDQRSLYSQSVHSSLLSAHWNENQMTSLEILKDKNTSIIRTENMIKIGDLLHGFLCEATGLQHLRGHGGYITFYNLRITSQGIMTWYPTRQAWARSKQRIWACRGLKTLEVEFVAGGANYLDDREHSRLVFGYISRVCPNLQNLSIKNNGMKLDLEGGLCLLSRLKSLRKLYLKPSWQAPLSKSDLDWIKKYHYYSTAMSLSEMNLKGRWKRMAQSYTGVSEKDRKEKSPLGGTSNLEIRPRFSRVMAYLQGAVLRRRDHQPDEDEDSSAQDRPDLGVVSDGDITLHRELLMVDGVDMTHVGHLSDIEQYFRERRTRRDECLWPDMEHLEIFHTCRPNYSKGDQKRLCEAMESYRPEIKFRCLVFTP
ncbi:hypothetical protein BGZ68_005291 [Mortierella alpina]|nr:hypothetical protein BGZ68_005291 [Mortierella alpina]